MAGRNVGRDQGGVVHHVFDLSTGSKRNPWRVQFPTHRKIPDENTRSTGMRVSS